MNSGEDDDIGPEDSMDLEPVEILEPHPDVEIILDVRVDRHEMAAVQRLADEWGVLPSRAIKRLVEEALQSRAAHRPA